MSVFGIKPNGPTRINHVQINQSVLGYALPVVMGRGKIQQSIIWTGDFDSKKVASGGKGAGGGKGGNQYVYSADVIAALCAGEIVGVGDVWSGQSWLRNTSASESLTITGGTYTPTNSAYMTADQGVSETQTFSASLTDLGAPSPTVLSGTHEAAFVRVAYGTALTAGKYSVDSANVYHFAAADVGRTVTLSYSFSLSIVTNQELDLIPPGRTISVGGSTPFAADGGVVYAVGTLAGQALRRVSGSPTATGTYSLSGRTYSFAPGDVAAEVRITFALNNHATLPAGTQSSLRFLLFEGTKGQSPWALLTTTFPGAALGYSGIALAAYGPMDLGYGAQIQQNVFEVLTPDGWGGGISDCSPVQCVLQVLTNPVWGLGAGAIPFPTSAIDNGAGGTWGTPGAGATVQDGTATSWFAANGFFISPVIDRQDTAASLMSRWLEAGQCAAFMSEGLLKLVPYGDTSTAGNGRVWTAPSAFAVALDDSCFLQKSAGEEPVKIGSSPYTEGYNTVQISWNNRASQYAPEPTPSSDQAAINRYGSRIEDPQHWDFITTLPAALFAGSMRVKRNVYTRNTYEFSLSYQYSYLEPMDIVTISTTSIWAAGLNNTNLGIFDLPVRITKVVDNPDGTLDFTAEDYPFGVNQPVLHNKDISTGTAQPNQYSDPGDSKVVLFNATPRLTAYKGPQIWMGASGENASWGGCNVLGSMDGVTYQQIAVIKAPARLGTLAAAFPTGADPDTTHSLVVNLVENSGALEAGTTADADNDNTLCYVDGELISYSACAISGQNQYTLNGYIRRAQMASFASAHASGSSFLRLDDAVLQYSYDPSWAGKTIYFKFQSFNVFGNSTQDPSTLTAVTFAVADSATTTLIVTGTTPHPTVSTSALTDLPELDSGNAAMTITTDGNAAQIGVTLQFSAGSGGTTGPVTGIGHAIGGSFIGSEPPEISISISGDGTGAEASVSWSHSGSYPYFTWMPSLYLFGGSGYTAATSTVVISNGLSSGPYANGTNTYTCNVSAATPQAGVPIQVRVLMDGNPVIGPVVVLSDSSGAASFSATQAVFPVPGAHSFEVQALNKNATYTVESLNRTFQFVALG